MIRTAARLVLVGLLLLGFLAGGRAWAQRPGVELLVAGTGYHESDLPANAAGTWWVLHRPAGETVLEAFPVVVTPIPTCGDDEPGERRGRVVSVPAAQDPILLLRNHPALSAGPVRTAFLDDAGAGEAARVEVAWGDQTLVVHHVTEPPAGDQPGTARIELTVDGRRLQLHSGEWHGDGHWRVRWIGDLNRDRWPDLLVDASHKYSVYTTRLYLSHEADGRLEVSEAATFSHTAC